MSVGKPSRFRDIQAKCLSARLLYEDPEFPAVPKSVYFSKTDPTIQWRRPGVSQVMYVKWAYRNHVETSVNLDLKSPMLTKPVLSKTFIAGRQ